MLFIYPMWDHESQRIGKQKCTPLGYKLHGIAEILGFIGLLLFVIVSAYLGLRPVGTFQTSQLPLLVVPVGLGLIGEVLYLYSWRLAARKGFHYDYATCEASWIEDGQRQTYKWKPNQNTEFVGCDMKTDRIAGSVLGLALGDAFGAPYEGGILERAVWARIGKRNGKRRWTDDTQMTIDLIDSLAACGRVDQNDLAHRFSQSYKWSRGYGPGAAKILKRIRRGQPWEVANRSVYRDGSFGNGGAMRAPVVGLFFATDNEDELVKAACASAIITHAHPFGREGAVLIALATALAFNDMSSQEIIERLCQRAETPEFLSRLHTARTWLQGGNNVAPRTVASELGNGIAAVESCVTAIYVALTFRNSSFNELLGFAIRLHGDVDTIAAMACAIWGAARGFNSLPQALLEQLEQFDHLKAVARSLAEAISNRPTS